MKTHINPSSIGSYFGVGFNSPYDQFLIDLGEKEQEFDEAAQSRLRLGQMLENASLDYFEETFGVIIGNRNTERLSFYDGKIIGKVDGTCLLNDIETVVENKISNAEGYKFTNSVGYALQCQCYMLDNRWKQALLCGLYHGKPIYKIIPRDEEMIADIKKMTDFVVDCLMGLRDFEKEFPSNLYEKYAHMSVLTPISANQTTLELVDKLGELKAKVAALKDVEKEISQIEDNLKENFSDGIIETPNYKLSIQTKSREGSIDADAIMIDHPEIDLNKYRKPKSVYKTVSLKIKK